MGITWIDTMRRCCGFIHRMATYPGSGSCYIAIKFFCFIIRWTINSKPNINTSGWTWAIQYTEKVNIFQLNWHNFWKQLLHLVVFTLFFRGLGYELLWCDACNRSWNLTHMFLATVVAIEERSITEQILRLEKMDSTANLGVLSFLGSEIFCACFY